MSALRIGLVTEGVTDQIIIRELFSAFCRINYPHVSAEFVNLQPRYDRTSRGAYGGWEMVYKWCLNNTPDVRREQFLGGGIFSDDMSDLVCDIIIVQMDSDICHAIGDKTSVRPVPLDDAPPVERGQFIRLVLTGWLWPEDASPDGRHYTAPTVESAETWLVAALAEADYNFESSKSIMKDLVEIDFRLRRRRMPDDAKKISKDRKNYERISKIAARNVSIVAARCQHFRHLIEEIFSDIR